MLTTLWRQHFDNGVIYSNDSGEHIQNPDLPNFNISVINDTANSGAYRYTEMLLIRFHIYAYIC